MPGPSHETQIALLVAGQKALEDKIAEMKSEVTALQDERNKALKWGVVTLGTAVSGMAYWIFNAVTGGHFK